MTTQNLVLCEFETTL